MPTYRPFTKYIYMMKLKAGFSTWPKIPFVNTDKIKGHRPYLSS